MSGDAPKIAMSLGGKPKKAPLMPAVGFAAGRGDAAENDDEDTPAEFVSQMVDGKVDGKKEQVRVIPAQQNTFSLGGAQHLRAALEAAPAEGAAPADAADDPAADPPAAATPAAAAEPASEDAVAAQEAALAVAAA